MAGARAHGRDASHARARRGLFTVLVRRQGGILEGCWRRTMALRDDYVIQPDGATWAVPQDFEVRFNWEYDEGRAAMMGLYRKGIEMQWNADTRIDWSVELDEDNPQQLPEAMLPISGMPQYEAMSRADKARVRRHFQ